MNIKEHIEAGHYPTDSKGRALVPMANGESTFVCCATDRPGSNCLFGWSRASGAYLGFAADSPSLLPPAPRKVEVKRWLVVGPSYEHGPYVERLDADRVARTNRANHVVELTGSYEEPWIK